MNEPRRPHAPRGPAQAQARAAPRSAGRRDNSRLARTRDAVERHRDEFVLVHAVSEAANESTSLSAVLREVTAMICAHMGWPVGHALRVVPDTPPTTSSLDRTVVRCRCSTASAAT